MNKNLSEMTSEELYAVARMKEREEAEKREKVRKAQLRQLKDKRGEIDARYRAELAEVDRAIAALGGAPTRSRKASGGDAAGRKGSMSLKLCEIIGSKPEMSIDEIREQAESAGLNTKNLNQALAYLKKHGRLTSSARGVYSVVS